MAKIAYSPNILGHPQGADYMGGGCWGLCQMAGKREQVVELEKWRAHRDPLV